ncbi:putative heme-binding protein 2-like [Capsicum annuum]|nr:putative heme-binding protein 2-like [Capsicum annuum]
MGHFGMTIPTLFDSDVLLVFSLVILIPVLNANTERHIHSMVDKAKSLGDTPSYEDLYMFRKMVRDQSSDCLRYVHEADRIQVSADYRRDEVQPDQLRSPIRRRGKDGVAGRRERAIVRNQVPD